MREDRANQEDIGEVARALTDAVAAGAGRREERLRVHRYAGDYLVVYGSELGTEPDEGMQRAADASARAGDEERRYVYDR